MSERTVTTQAELDKAIKDKIDWIDIRSDAGVWFEVTAYGSSTVTAYDSSTVRAYGSSTVTAYGSSTVRAYDSSTVTAYGSSTVTAYGSSTVKAYGSSTVTACGSSTVRAYGSSTVTAYDSSTVTAYGSSTVTAYDSSTVRAYDSSTVRAYDSSTVRAYDSSTVRASKYAAVHLHSATVSLKGGHVIDHTKVDMADAKTWCAYHGVKVTKGIATLYKAVNDKYTTDRGTDYSPGATPTAPDWNNADACGNGLHFGPTPARALAYHQEATRFMEAQVALKDLVPITGGGTAKCKAPGVVAPLVEVTIHIERVTK